MTLGNKKYRKPNSINVQKKKKKKPTFTYEYQFGICLSQNFKPKKK